MKKKLHVPPLSEAAQAWNRRLRWIMCLAQGTWKESPQETHFWNNVKFRREDLDFLELSLMVHVERDSTACRRWLGKIPLFHIPILGGWKNYVILEPVDKERTYHVGWIAGDVCGVSQILLKGPVRLLQGPGEVYFFAVDALTGEQIELTKVGHGRIGCGGEYAQVPLL